MAVQRSDMICLRRSATGGKPIYSTRYAQPLLRERRYRPKRAASGNKGVAVGANSPLALRRIDSHSDIVMLVIIRQVPPDVEFIERLPFRMDSLLLFPRASG